ncbi:MAG: hypothetical protein K2G24_01255 [Muribaculaceae bacterium]|nr:hypothetical protein [Muribaculaceae bacterium]
MSRNRFPIIAILSVLALASCDEGRLYDEDAIIVQEGGCAHITATVSGLETWPGQYTLAVAGFENGNEFALISKNIETSVSDGRCDIVLTGIPPEVSTVELCAIDRLRRRAATFASGNYTAGSDTLRLDFNQADLSMAGAIQREIFNTTCIQCHGGSNFVAAGLNLTEGHSFGDMISVPSVKAPEFDRVRPGDSSSSIIFLILGGNASASWSYDHSVEIIRQEKLDLIRNWIDGGANAD